MAGRPLTLVVKDNQDGTASIRMPESAGVKQRGTLKFPSRKVAERYRTAALAAHQAGKSFPDPAPYQSALDRRKAPKIPDRFADVAWAWFKKTYPAHYKNPERRAAVEQIIETHLISFFGPRVDRISEISSEDCEEFVDFMAGERITTPTSSDDKARELTLTEAAKLTGRNRSTLQRAWQNGQFPRARKTNRGKSKGIVVIPFSDTASLWGVKRMKTKWGSCNPASKSIWVNSELAKKPLECLEYIVVHELVHLLVPRHGDAFGYQMDRILPSWRPRRDLLNSSPLAHEEWVY